MLEISLLTKQGSHSNNTGLSQNPIPIPNLFCSFCLQSSLNKTMAEGKILVCRQTERSLESKLAKSTEVKNAGGVGMILIDEMNNDVAVPFNLPAASIGLQTGDQILSYAANNTRFQNQSRLQSSTPPRTLIPDS